MTQQPVEANVVLTADTSQYDSAMAASSASTASLGAAVDGLGQKLDNLAKAASRKLVGIAAADIAVITAATTAYGAWESQMEDLQAQAAILNTTVEGQNRTFKEYASTVNGLRSTFGMATREAAELTQVVSRMADGTRSVQSLTNTFARLGAATGESSVALADGVMQLNRTMGGSDRDVGRYANALTNLSASTSTSATGITQLAQQIAPVGRMINMSTTDVLGVSQAFAKAGQDGFAAGNAFTKMASDIASATHSGSTGDLATYANLIGMTVEQFKSLDKTEGVTRIFEELNRQGPAAITTLNRMGLDGMRTMRSITAVSQQSGGLRQAISTANTGDPEALQRGSAAAMDGLADQLKRIRSELAMTGESFGSRFAGPMKFALTEVNEFVKGLRALTEGPLGTMASWVAGIAAPFTLLAAAVLGGAKALGIFAGAMALLRNSGTAGFIEGRRGFGAIGGRQTTAPIGPRGANVDARGNWVGRSMYNWSQAAGAGTRNVQGAFRGMMGSDSVSGTRMGAWWANRPSAVDPSTPGALSRTAALPLRLAGAGFRLIGDTYSPGQGVNAQAMRQGGLSGFWSRAWGGAPMDTPENRVRVWNRQSLFDRNSVPEGSTNQFQRLSGSLNEASKRVTGFGAALHGAGRNLGYMMGSIANAGVGATRMAGRGIGALAGSALGSFGPWGLAMMGGMGAYYGYQAMRDDSGGKGEDMSGSMDPYLTQAGRSPVAAANTGWTQDSNVATTIQDAMTVDQADVQTATHSQYQMTQPKLKGMSISEATAYLANQWDLVKDDATVVNSIKLDLVKALGGADAANQVLTNLSTGGAEGQQSIKEFMGSSADLDRRWKMGLGFIPGNWGLQDAKISDVREKIDVAGGMVTDRANFASMMYGEEAGRMERAKGDAELLGEWLRAGGGENARSINADMGSSAVEAMSEFMKENGYGESFDEEDLRYRKSGGYDEKKSNADLYREFLEQSYLNPENKEISEQDRRNFLSNRGINPDFVDDTDKAIDAVMAYVEGDYDKIAQYDPDSLAARLGRVTGGETRDGRDLMGMYEVKEAMANEGDVNKQIEGINSMLRAMKEAGNSPMEIERVLGDMKAQAKSGREYEFFTSAQAMNQRNLGFSMADMSITDRYLTSEDLYAQRMAIAEGDPNEMQLKEQAEQERHEAQQQAKNYLISLLTAQREFNISRARSEFDFALQRERQDYQYNLQRTRAEEDYNRQREQALEDYHTARDRGIEDYERQQERATSDYWRSMARQRDDYQLSRRRQEEDFQHQVGLMAERAALSVHNIYERIEVQRTSSADWLMHNTQEQLASLEGQARNLSRLRRMGVSDDVIQQMGLTDSKNAQQLERFVADLADNPNLVRKFNRQIQRRIGAARELVTDESSSDWQEFTRQHRLSRRRAQDDFERSVSRSREDFRRQMGRSDEDFRRSLRRSHEDFWKQMDRNEENFDLSMDRMAEDYATSVEQMEDDFDRQMRRAQKDLDRMARQITGSMEDILRKSIRTLSGTALEQAEIIRGGFEGIEEDSTGIATRMMRKLSRIFGVKWEAPPTQTDRSGSSASGANRDDVAGPAWASGGVLPGWSPGYDNMTFAAPGVGTLKLSGGEAIMRPEWTRAVGGPKAIEEMNHKAKHGMAFAEGGVAPAVGGWNQHTSGYPDARWSGDINVPGDETGNRVGAWKAGRVSDVERWNYSYGHHVRINHPDSNEQTLYAHLSKILVEVGDMVSRGEKIGEVGSTGKATGPHLHFEILGGTGPIDTTGVQAAAAGAKVSDILKDRYPSLERAAAAMVPQIFGQGDISKIMNRFGRKAWRKAVREHGAPGDSANHGDTSAESAPSDISANAALGKRMARNWGWAGNQWDSLYQLWQSESGWNHTADNPGSSAYGIPQALIDLHDMPNGYYARRTGDGKYTQGYGGDPETQIRWGLNYIRSVYGDPESAWSFKQDHNWYGKGGLFTGPTKIGVGERGGEMVLPLDRHGVDFLGALMKRLNPGLEGRATNVSGYQQPISSPTINTYQIDRSTNFHGSITVQAQDPNEFVSKLRQRERTRALTQPSIGGARV